MDGADGALGRRPTVIAVRWDDLFADLEAQVAATDDAAWLADVADLAGAERAAVCLIDRLLAHASGALRLALLDGSLAVGDLTGCGEGWVRLRTAGQHDLLVPTHAVVSMTGLGRHAVTPAGPPVIDRRVGLVSVLRGLARSRAAVEVRLVGPRVITGSLGEVGADHMDLAEHPGDDLRRSATVVALHTVRLAAVVSVRPL